MATLYDRIRQRREELGMTQEELALKMGYKSRSSINKIELGINDISQTKILEFAKALSTSTGYLMGIEPRPDIVRAHEELFGDSGNPFIGKLTVDEYPAINECNKVLEDEGHYSQIHKYYLDDETAKKAQEIYEDNETRILLDAKRDLKKEDLDYIVGLVKRFKGDK